VSADEPSTSLTDPTFDAEAGPVERAWHHHGRQNAADVCFADVVDELPARSHQ